MRSIAIIGRRGSGKTTIANALIARIGYTRHSWAAPVKEIASWAYGLIDKAGTYTVNTAGHHNAVSGRWVLQHIGTDALRNQVDQDFWVKVGLRKIDTSEDDVLWVNDDTRFSNEVEALRSRGFLVVRLNAPTEVRAKRLGAEYNPEADHHASETETDRLIVDLDLDATRPVAAIVSELLANAI